MKCSEYFIKTLNEFHFHDDKTLDSLFRKGAEIFLQESSFSVDLVVKKDDSDWHDYDLNLCLHDLETSDTAIEFDLEKILDDSISRNTRNVLEIDIEKLSLLHEKLTKFNQKLNNVITDMKKG